MNPMLGAKALKEAIRLLSSSNAAEELAKTVTKRSVTNPATTRSMTVQTNPDIPAEVLSIMGGRTVVPSPQQVSYDKMLAPFDIRDERNTLNFIKSLDANQANMMPVADRLGKINRRTGFGAGAGLAIPPSLYALWLMSQQDDNEE